MAVNHRKIYMHVDGLKITMLEVVKMNLMEIVSVL